MDAICLLSAISAEMRPYLHGLLYAWFLATGGCIGSFLNVVIYRVPAGKSIAYPGSQCPRCGHAIRARDNLPVLGWMLLGGKCRDCQASIPIRYPLVELTVALLFLGFGAMEVVFRAVNVPHWGPVTTEILEDPLPWTICGYHLFFVCTLLCVTLIELDGHRVPVQVVLPALIVGTVCPLVVPQLMPVGFDGGSNQSPILTSLFGFGAGGLMGGLVLASLSRFSNRPASVGPAYSLLLVGVFVGWQSTVCVTILLNLVLIASFYQHRRGAVLLAISNVFVLGASLVWVLNWRYLHLLFLQRLM